MQGAFEWRNRHPIYFTLNGEIVKGDLRKIGLQDVLDKNNEVGYIYNDWKHHIIAMSNEELSGTISPLHPCIDGKRSRPPEDMGNIDGYDRFLEVISDSSHPRYDETLKWAERDTYGRKFDPEYFYKNASNRKIDFYMNVDNDLLDKELKGEVVSLDGDRIVIITSKGPLTLNDVEHLLAKHANKAEVIMRIKRMED